MQCAHFPVLEGGLIFRLDRGTDFIGAKDDLKIDTISVEEEILKKLLYASGTKWILNPPHSSHFGGAWEG